MKQLFLPLWLLLFFLPFSTHLKAQGLPAGDCWTWQNPLPQGNELNDVFFVDGATGWAVGGAGTILKTVNGGTTWAAQTSGTVNSLRSVHFSDGQTGWAVGDAGTILKTVNGGTTWAAQTSGTANSLRSVHFSDGQTGWAVGDKYTILKTLNGGATWTTQTSGTNGWLYSVYFSDSQAGWAVGDFGTILKTLNGGATWTTQTSGTTDWLYSVYFSDNQTGWAVGSSGTILKTLNGGATWTAQTSGMTNTLYSVYFANNQTGWVVGQGGTILKTVNGGSTWTAQTSGTTDWLYSVYFIDSQTGWVVGEGGTILKTVNGGSTWTAQTSGTANHLFLVYFIDSQTGWAMGGDGTILKTLNGGATWTAQTSGTTNGLRSVYFINSQTGWAVGTGGTILKTLNGGATWTTQTSGTTNNISSVYFIDSQTGWAAGGSGTILKTLNGGATWAMQTSGTTNDISSVYFSGSQTGWAVGESGTILKTLNGGATWTTQTSGTTGWLLSVYLSDSQTGWAVGWNGTILKTLNGGATWTMQTSGTTKSLYSVHFIDAQTGWAVGDAATILKTVNGGSTWTEQTTETGNTLYSVYFTNAQTGWAVGDFGTILKHTPSAPSCLPTIPLHLQTNIPTTTAITWPPASGCEDGYRLSLGTTPGGSDILNNLTVAATFYQPSQPLPGGKTVYVRVVPYNGVGSASGCSEFSFVTAGSNSCDAAQKQADSLALVALYTSTNGPGWTIKTNWLVPGVPVGSWYGVKTNSSGCVTRLLLSNNNLQGTLPSAIGDFAEMDTMILSFNAGLMGAIPTSISGLSSMKALSFGACNLNGSIPSSIGNMTTLTNLGLNNNQLSGSIPPELGNLSNCTDFYLHQNNLTGSIPAALSGLSSVQFFWLHGNNLSGCIPPEIHDLCPHVTSGNISNNPQLAIQSWANFCANHEGECCYLPLTATLTGTNTICNGSSTNLTFTFSNGTGPYDVVWSEGTLNDIPNGHILSVSPTTTTTYTISSVTDSYGCTGTSTSVVTITVQSIPAAPDPITGDATVCVGVPKMYSIASVAGATSYNWTVPTGATIQSGQGTVSVNILWTTPITGDVCVRAQNTCGNSAYTCLPVTSLVAPAQPDPITGATTVCAFNLKDYTIPSVSGATGYTWTATGGNIVGGQGTSTASVDWAAGTNSVCVVATGACGNSPQRCLSVTTVAQPTQLVINPGNFSPCQTSTQTYSVNAQAAFSNYQWTVPAGAIIIAGQSTPNVTVTWEDTSSGDLCVEAISAVCGTSASNCQSISVQPFPQEPDAVMGADTVCIGTPISYSIDTVPGATAYHWLSNGATILSGQGSTTVSILWNTPTATNVCARAQNGCGSTIYKCTGVLVKGETALAQPGPISGSVNTCIGSTGNYTIAPVPGADTYTWAVPPNASLISAQDSISITVKWNSPGSGDLCITASADCGVSSQRCLSVTTTDLPSATASGGTLICTAPNISLMGSSSLPATYAWVGPNGFTSISQNPTVNTPGTYTLTVTSSPGCTATATVTVADNQQPPNISATGGLLPCLNPSVVLQGASSTPGATYAWVGLNGFTFNGQNPTVNSPGTYTLTVSGPNGCTATATATVTPAAPPVAGISGEKPICPGGSAVLTATGVGDYSWAGPNGFTFNGQQPTVNTPGTYTLTVTDANGCTATATATIAAAPPLNVGIAGLKTVCPGGSTLLTASGGDDYDWIGPGGFLANGQQQMVSSPGVYTVTASDAEGCTGTSTVSVAQYPAPVALLTSSDPDNTICTGDAVTFTASGGVAYQFWLNGVAQQGSFSPTNTFSPTGLSNGATVAVRMVDANTCQDSTQAGDGSGREPLTLTVNTSPNLGGWSLTRVPSCPEDPVRILINAPNLPNGAYTFDWELDNQTAVPLQQNLAGGVGVLDLGVLPAGFHLGRISNIGLSNGGCTATPPSGSSVSFEVKPLIATTVDTTVCQGQPVKVGTQIFTQSGAYTVQLQSKAGCDSTVTLQLKAVATLEVKRTVEICAEGTYVFYGDTLDAGGFYQKTVPGPFGCDSLIQLYLSEFSPSYEFKTETICPGAAFSYGDSVFTKAGNYQVVLLSKDGCDSATLVLTLKIAPISVSFGTDEVRTCQDEPVQMQATAQNCTGCKYTWSTGASGTNLASIFAPQTSTTASYSVTVRDNKGCTASDTLLLTVVEPYFIERDTLLCPGESLNWCGKNITQTSEHVCTYTSVEGCDSTVTLRVDVFKPEQFQVARDTAITMPPDEKSWAFNVSHGNYPADYVHVIRNPPPAKGTVTVQADQRLLYTPDSTKRSGTDVVRFALCPPANCPDECSEAVLIINLEGIVVEEIEKKAPNLITPNGDGLNDFFNPLNFIRWAEEVTPDLDKGELWIYNRWGELLRYFEDVNPSDQGWDGKDHKGNDLPQAPYYYWLKYEIGSKPFHRRGPVNLLR